MANIAILVPQLGLREMAAKLVQQDSHFHVSAVEYVRTDMVEERARQLESQGCNLIIARGYQAALIKNAVQLPVVDIRTTTQELGMLIMELRRMLGPDLCRIAVINFPNMLCDTSHFYDLFQVKLTQYSTNTSSEMLLAVEQAVLDGAQAVIGGEIVCEKAEQLGIPARFLPSGEESLRNALEIAHRVCYAIDLEKRDSAEMDAMLNYTFNGIMQIDVSGTIRRANRAMFNLIERTASEILDKPVTEILRNLDAEILEAALSRGEETYSFLLKLQQKAVIVNVAPIQIDGVIQGAILTFQEGRRILDMNSELRRELYQKGFTAKCTFDRFLTRSKTMSGVIAAAKRISKYTVPLLLIGEEGTGKSTLAQCIHNNSLSRDNAFIQLDCAAWSADSLDTMLFGTYTTKKDTPTTAELAQDGTLYLEHIEALTAELQYKILLLTQGKFLRNGPYSTSSLSVRVIVSSTTPLIDRVNRGQFRSDLYFALNVLSLTLPPLRCRTDDILELTGQMLEKYQREYGRLIRLPHGARKRLEQYNWPGNLDQLGSLCQRLVLLSEKQLVDETFLVHQLEESAPEIQPDTGHIVVYRDPQAIRLAELLQKHQGRRDAVAQELGVSKTTLWRYMKKYGLG
mgnify:FL=1